MRFCRGASVCMCNIIRAFLEMVIIVSEWSRGSLGCVCMLGDVAWGTFCTFEEVKGNEEQPRVAHIMLCPTKHKEYGDATLFYVLDHCGMGGGQEKKIYDDQ